MFTGIVQEVGQVISMQSGDLEIAASTVLQGLVLGASVAVNGSCLTVTRFDNRSFTVHVTPETLKRTNLKQLVAGDIVNLEKPLSLGGELGGHLVQGHVDGTGKLVSMTPEGSAIIIRFEAPPGVMRYIVEKGFITVDGMSLTVIARDASSFAVSIVDYTRRHTNLSKRKAGDDVNLEADIIAKYVEQFLQIRQAGVTSDFLRENGF